MAERIRSGAYFDLCSALAQPGCGICRLVERWERRYVANLFEESVNDVGTRQALQAAWGFCAAHAAMAEAVHDVLGLAIIYGGLAQELQQTVAALAVAPNERGALRRPGGERRARLAPRGECPVCAHRRLAEDVYVGTLLSCWPEPDLQAAFAAGEGLCLPHLRFATGHPEVTGEALSGLLAAEAEKLGALRQELEQLQRHFDFRFQNEPLGAAGTSWHRALHKFTGGVPDPSRHSSEVNGDGRGQR